MRKVYYADIGLTDFDEIWTLQREINLFKQTHKSHDLILFTQHNHVFTLGKSGDRNHLLISEEILKKEKVSYYEIDRGGDLTYHGPGQLVCYPIIDLNNYYKDTHRYLRDLEEVIIRTLKHYGIDSGRDEAYTGVWIGEDKICAIGVKITRWITMHGLALNVNNELNYFDKIIPCGIFHKGVTSMKKIMQESVDINELTKVVVDKFHDVFDMELESIDFNGIKLMFNISNHFPMAASG